jgi:hypothetical protein
MEQMILQILEAHLQRMANVKELREDLKAKEEAHLERMKALLGLRPCEKLKKAREFESRPGRNGGRGGYLQGEFG